MKISSDDIAPILTALGGFLTVVGGIVTNLVMTIRQGKRLDKHKAEIEDLQNSTGTHKAIGNES